MRQDPGGNVNKHARHAAAVAVMAGLASAAYQAVSEARDRRRYPPPGRLVDIGGRRLHLVSMGEGEPAVVIIPALADNVLQWVPILEGVAAETQAVAYDRAGVGWSEPPPRWKRTPDLMAADLHALLRAASIPPPYVLVGHSIGGVIARRFYAQKPGLTAGILLIDSSHENQAKRFDAAHWRKGTFAHARVIAARQARVLGARRLAVRLGLAPDLKADLGSGVPPEYEDAERAIMLSTRQRRTMVREMLMMVRLRDAPPHLHTVPLTVLTALKKHDPALLAAWLQMQDELAALSSDSVHVMARDAGHYVHLDDPDIVIQAIRDLVRRCR
jgi:pimeloyl-ACP methyl ester carboxylesterase